MRISEMPVLLLTGYLGSGKTTLVNRILSNSDGIRFAVIVNDLGEVNIDADLIARDGIVGKSDDSLVALQNGCICCTLKMDLVEQLRGICAMHRFDYIVIEASGICEPEPIARTVCSIPYMGSEYVADGIPYLDCIVTVVDALRMRDEFACAGSLVREGIDEEDIENLVIQQVEFCNVVLLNKASEVCAEDLGRIRAIIRAIQPKARIIDCDWADVPMDTILETGLFDYDSVAGSAAWITAVEGRDGDDDDDMDDDDDDDDDDGHHGHHHHHHHHEEGEAEEYGIGTYVYSSRRAMDLGRFDHFVARRMPPGIIRAKGICYFSDERDICYLFEKAGSQISMSNIGSWYATMSPQELRDQMRATPDLARDWDPEVGDRMQRLVFIGQHLDAEYIRHELDLCLE